MDSDCYEIWKGLDHTVECCSDLCPAIKRTRYVEASSRRELMGDRVMDRNFLMSFAIRIKELDIFRLIDASSP